MPPDSTILTTRHAPIKKTGGPLAGHLFGGDWGSSSARTFYQARASARQGMNSIYLAPPRGIPPALELMTAKEAQLVQSTIRGIATVARSAHLEDLLAMASFVVSQALEQRQLSRNSAFNVREFLFCENLSLVRVLSIEHMAARAAGIFSLLDCPADVTHDRVNKWKLRWGACYDDVVDRGHACMPADLPEPRERTLFAFALWHADQRIQPFESLMRTIRSAKAGANRRQNVPVPAAGLERNELISDAALIVRDVAVLQKCWYIDREGRFAIRRNAARDALVKTIPRGETSADLRAMARGDEAEPNVLQELEDAEAIEVLRACQADRRSQTRVGSAVALVVEHMTALASGEVTLSALSREHGFSPAALSQAYSDEKKRLERELRRRGAL